jgi:hypothetical protein
MKFSSRGFPALAAALVLLALAVPATSAAPTLHVHYLRASDVANGSTGAGGRDVGLSPGPCEDGAFKLLGAKWRAGAYAWSFNASSTPPYLGRTAARDKIARSFTNVTSARNDCGIADNVSATHTFLGTTASRARCSSRDQKNVIGFKALEFGVLAVTCFWTFNGRMVEADMQITTREHWALTMATCDNEPMLEATVTHEAGHVYGLDHVGERRHGRLTMSPFLDGPCNNNEATLGKGDIRGLAQLY